MARPRVRDAHLPKGVRVQGDKYYFRSTKSGPRPNICLGVVGDLEGMLTRYKEVTRAHQAAGRIRNGASTANRPAIPRISGPVVYFLRAGLRGAIKIGFSGSAQGAIERIRLLQIGSPETLHVIGIIPGSRELEKQLHVELSEWLIRSEWFRPTEPVLATLATELARAEVRPNKLGKRLSQMIAADDIIGIKQNT
jgi:hypothetical protein